MPIDWTEFGRLGLAALIVAAVAGVPVAVIALARRRHDTPTPGDWKATWGGVEVVLVFALYILLGAVTYQSLTSAGGFDRLGYPLPAEDSSETDRILAMRSIWTELLILPAFVGVTLVIVRPGHVGLGFRHPGSDAIAGYRGWALWTPAVFACLVLTNLAWHQISGDSPDAHPTAELWASATAWEKALLWLRVTVAAAVSEELLCRGVLLIFLFGSLDRSRFVLAVAVLLAYWKADAGGGIELWAPAVFVAAIAGLHYLLWRDERSPWQAIVAGAALFAAMHSNVWPSPIPLFVLGCGLGWLTWRTRSLLPAILMHGLFNAITATYLELGGSV